MTTAARQEPGYWTVRRYGEPVPAWAGRMARDYAAAHPEALARLDAAGRADTRAHQRREEYTMPGDEFGKDIELAIEQGQDCIARSEALQAAMETGHWWQAGWRRRNTRRCAEIRRLHDQAGAIIRANDLLLLANQARLVGQQEQIRVNGLRINDLSQPADVMASLETQVTIRQLISLAAGITTGLADSCQEPERWTLTTLIARATGLHGDSARLAIFRLISEQAGPAVSLSGINDLGGQDPYPRYGRADYGNGTDSWDSTEANADDG